MEFSNYNHRSELATTIECVVVFFPRYIYTMYTLYLDALHLNTKVYGIVLLQHKSKYYIQPHTTYLRWPYIASQ